jgi:hypothetical protein
MKQEAEYEPRLRSVDQPSTGHHLNLAPLSQLYSDPTKTRTSTSTNAKVSNQCYMSTLLVPHQATVHRHKAERTFNKQYINVTIQVSYTSLFFSHHQ